MNYPDRIYLQYNIQTSEIKAARPITSDNDDEFLLYVSILTLQCDKGPHGADSVSDNADTKKNFKIIEGGDGIDSVFLADIVRIYNGENPSAGEMNVKFHTSNALYKVQKITTAEALLDTTFFGVPLSQWAGNIIAIKIGDQRYYTTIPEDQAALVAITAEGEIPFTKGS